jgi:hypothetical protein
MSLTTPMLCSEVAGGVTQTIVCLFREPDAGNPPVRLRVQGKLVCTQWETAPPR